MLIKLVVDIEGLGLPEVSYIEFPEDSCNILKITERKLTGIHKTWRSRTKDMDDPEQIIQTFYDILDEKDIDYHESGPDVTLHW